MSAKPSRSHPLSPGASDLSRLSPGGVSLVSGSRDPVTGVAFWWMGWVMLHERTLRPIWFGDPRDAHRFDPAPRGPGRLLLQVRLGRWAARSVPVRGLHDYLDGETRVLYTGQNRQWPGADGTANDRFFAPLLQALHDAGAKTASTYPLSNTFPWFAPGSGRRVGRARNAATAAAPHLPLERFVTRSATRALSDAMRQFGARADEIEADWDSASREIPELRDRSVGPLVRDAVLHLHRTVFPVAALLIECAREALRRLRPHLVVIINEYGLFERALQVAAARDRIPTLAVQHGVIHPYHPGYVYPASFMADGSDVDEALDKDLRVPCPDRLAVYGSHHRRLLVDTFGWPEDRVVVTGHPNGDRVHGLRERSGARPPHTAPRMLWLTQVHGFPAPENRTNERIISEMLRHLASLEFVVKPHPRDDPRAFDALRTHPQVTVLDKSVDLYETFLGVDVALTKDSTAALEAMAFDRPVVVLNATDAPDRVDYVEKGAALAAHDAETLIQAIRRSLDDDPTQDRRKEYVREQFGPTDGRNTERLMMVVQGLVADAATQRG